MRDSCGSAGAGVGCGRQGSATCDLHPLRCVLPFLCATAFLVLYPVLAAAQVTVRGTVVERTYSTAVASATVELGERTRFTTDEAGAFRFAVAPGRYTVTVSALGYARRELSLDLRADTTLVIELEIDAILLDSLRAEGGHITIKGTIYDRETGYRLPNGQIFVSTGDRYTARLNGSFRIRRVPVGRAVAVDVMAVGYESERIAIVTGRDTTVNVRLIRDSVAIRRIERFAEMLEVRSRAVNGFRYIFDHERLERLWGWTVADVLQTWRFSRLNPTCFFVDEMRMDLGEQFMFYLETFLAQEIWRIEVFDKGGMVRVYTRQYLATLPGDLTDFAPIIYAGRWGLGNACF